MYLLSLLSCRPFPSLSSLYQYPLFLSSTSFPCLSYLPNFHLLYLSSPTVSFPALLSAAFFLPFLSPLPSLPLSSPLPPLPLFGGIFSFSLPLVLKKEQVKVIVSHAAVFFCLTTSFCSLSSFLPLHPFQRVTTTVLISVFLNPPPYHLSSDLAQVGVLLLFYIFILIYILFPYLIY